MPNPPKDHNEISSLLQVVQDLRGPDGCPWDKEQTHETLAPYAIEETFEMIEALESKSDIDFCDELGDVLFQVALHSQLAKERGAFQFSDVVAAITSKIVRRHPHVFADLKVKDSAEVLKNWDEIKAEEKKLKAQTWAQQNPSAPMATNPQTPFKKVFKIPKGLPALQAANAIGEKTQKYNFDWFHASQVLAQLKEEIQELEQAMSESVSPEAFIHMEQELGDVLFSAAQLARHLKIEPETALRKTNSRFEARFLKMLEIMKTAAGAVTGLSQDELLFRFASLSQNEKEILWEQAKRESANKEGLG